jgi:serine/threonine protein kinase
VLPEFQQILESRLLASLELDVETRRAWETVAAAAWKLGASGCDALLEQGALDPDRYRAAVRAQRPAPIAWGSFTVERELGRGVSGVVYQALWAQRPAALKVLRVDAGENVRVRFAREQELLARLEHPGIVGLLTAGEHEGVFYLATELVSSGSLADRALPLAPREAFRVAIEMTEALAAAHAQGVIHRDLKPSNVLIDLEGHPRLVDFGLAKDLGAAPLTGSNTLLGSPLWSPPEQLGGASRVDARADVYGAMAVFHALLTGGPPFPAPTLGQLLRAQLEGIGPLIEGQPLSGPARVYTEALLQRALSPRLELRPSSALELRDELRRCQQLHGASEPPPG